MQFYVVPYRKPLPDGMRYPSVVLNPDGWNDFGYTTLFTLEYHRNKYSIIAIGSVKILHAEKHHTQLPATFTRLDVHYCSLGQSLDYYKQLGRIRKEHRDLILHGLRDVVELPALVARFAAVPGWKKSLLRFSEAEQALRGGADALVAKESREQPIEFDFETALKGASAPLRAQFRFNDHPNVPNRIIALVGKNGTGKTWFLSRLAAAISGDDPRNTKFHGARPPFGRAIALSYSALDRFRRPGNERLFSYRYCGIFDDNGRLATRLKLIRRMQQAAKRIAEKKRQAVWKQVLSHVLDENLADQVFQFLGSADKVTPAGLPPMSAGQLILSSTLTGVVDNIEQASLLLYDEPELHLHPNAVGGLMRALDRVLTTFKSYAIMATHSPLILQQVPARYVRLFTRIGQQTIIQPLTIESFGQNLTVLTEELFHASDTPSTFREWARSVARPRDNEALKELFEHPLSFDATMLIQALRDADDEGINSA